MKNLVRRWVAISDRNRVRIARSIVVLSAAIGALSIWAYVTLGEAGYILLDGRLFDDWVLHNVLLGAFGMSLLVWFAVPSQPRNGALWALTWSALFQAVNAGANAWSLAAANAAGIEGEVAGVPLNELPLSVGLPQQLSAWTWVPGLGLLLTLFLLLLPNGKLLSRAWRPVALGSVAAIAALSAGLLWMARPGQATTASLDAIEAAWVGPLFLPLMASAIVCTFGLIVRYRRSAGEARVRLRWIAWGGSLFGLSILTFPITTEAVGEGSAFQYLSLVTGTVLLVAIFVSITKHRLYDIDVVVSKTVTEAAMAAQLIALYVGVVVGVSRLVNAKDQIDFDIQVIATVLVAIAFQPARRRARAWANRLVYGQRSSPYEVLATFSHRAADASDDELLARLPQLIVDGTAATRATIWVEAGDSFRPAASWPVAVDRSAMSIASSFTDPKADHALAVYHDGELLGGLSLSTDRGDALPPPEQELVEHLAAGLGLALRNARLAVRLREQVAELEASRERILAAADEARRDLERDLDSGPQQQLVALKVKLGPIRIKAEQAGAIKTADIVAQLETEAGDAIQAVRDFSSGVYPPLLEAEGVVVALRQRIRKASFPITVKENGVGRYPRDVEAAIYFAILESLQNVAKYANASAVDVEIRDTAGELSFQVRDDGDGFDTATSPLGSGLANMADRLDAIGGRLSVDSTRGTGTVVSGSVAVVVLAALS